MSLDGFSRRRESVIVRSMNSSTVLQALLRELEGFGISNDAANRERSQRMLNITRETGEFLTVLVRATRASRILEIGTSNGYSTLWLASTGDVSVTTVEQAPYKLELAAENFRRGQVAERITLVPEDAGKFIAATESASFDFIFLDSERSEYAGWFINIKRILAPGGLLVVDNATSHPEELAEFTACLQNDGEFTTSLVPVGNGELMAVKATVSGDHGRS